MKIRDRPRITLDGDTQERLRNGEPLPRCSYRDPSEMEDPPCRQMADYVTAIPRLHSHLGYSVIVIAPACREHLLKALRRGIPILERRPIRSWDDVHAFMTKVVLQYGFGNEA